jgi:Uncharacterized conserved protein
MKKVFAMALSAICLFGCDCIDCGQEVFSVSPGNFYFHADYMGGTVIVTSSYNWTAQINHPSISLTAMEGAGGITTLTLTLSADFDPKMDLADPDNPLVGTVYFTSNDGRTAKVDVFYISKGVPLKGGPFMMGYTGDLDADKRGGLNSTLNGLRPAYPRHEVKLSPFRIGIFEVTVAEYAAFLNTTGVGGITAGSDENGPYISGRINGVMQPMFYPCDWNLIWTGTQWVPCAHTSDGDYGKYPMNNVTWAGALAYAKWVGGTLPTEAQWEYACRADDAVGTSFPGGNGKSSLRPYAVFDEDATPGDGTISLNVQLKPVGTKQVNGFGLYDVYGNVWEWCLDTWNGERLYNNGTAYSNVPIDPVVTTDGTYHARRGGAFTSPFVQCDAAFRNHKPNPSKKNTPSDPGLSFSDIGFRVVWPM